MSVWFVPNKNQSIQFIAIRSGLVLSRKPHQTDRMEARKIWNRLVEMGYTP
jgi:hypothetical protein